MHKSAKLLTLSALTTAGVEYVLWKSYFQPALQVKHGWLRSVLLPSKRSSKVKKRTRSKLADITAESTPTPPSSPQSIPLEEQRELLNREVEPIDISGSRGEAPASPDWKAELASLVSIADDWGDEVDDDGKFVPIGDQPCAANKQLADEEKFTAGTEREVIDETQLDPIDLAVHRRLLIAHRTGIANTWPIVALDVESFTYAIDHQNHATRFHTHNLNPCEWPLPADVPPVAQITEPGHRSDHLVSQSEQTPLKSAFSRRRRPVASTQDLWAGFNAHAHETNMSEKDVQKWKASSIPENTQRATRVTFGEFTIRPIDRRPHPSAGISAWSSYPDETHAREKYDAWTWKLYGYTEGPFQIDETDEDESAASSFGESSFWTDEDSEDTEDSDGLVEDEAICGGHMQTTKGLGQNLTKATVEFPPFDGGSKSNPIVNEFV